MQSLSIKVCKGKAKVIESGDVLGSKPLEDEEAPVQFDVIESYSEIEVLKKSLQSFKEHNMYLNDSYEKLMIVNRRMREDLEEIYTKYQELISVSKEALTRKRVIEQQYEEMVNQNKDLQNQMQDMEAEQSRLKKRS